MTPLSRSDAFFLDTDSGKRYCLFHRPAIGVPCKGAVVHVHPFGEEMNKTRRPAALQARALASLGFAVLQMDLHGCGDSSGELRDATWDGWKNDLLRAKTWVENESGKAASFWAVRLGALLALDLMQEIPDAQHLVLWQPVLNGGAYLTQLLRAQLASGMLGKSVAGPGVSEMKQQLLAGGASVEISGYDLTAGLAQALEPLDAGQMSLRPLHVDWLEVVPSPGAALAPARAAVAKHWQSSGVSVRIHLVEAGAFWSSQEIQEVPTLIEATCRVLENTNP